MWDDFVRWLKRVIFFFKDEDGLNIFWMVREENL